MDNSRVCIDVLLTIKISSSIYIYCIHQWLKNICLWSSLCIWVNEYHKNDIKNPDRGLSGENSTSQVGMYPKDFITDLEILKQI